MTDDKIRTDDIQKEIEDLRSFPDDRFIEIIREVGFECDCCGKCCTSEFNDHVFLLDDDAEKIIQSAGRGFLRPAPYYEFCDNLGRFYVMGYALRTKCDGSCIFYTGKKCEHYEIRPAVCRIYPYLLHREPDDDGNIEWRQIAGLNRHGLYYSDIDPQICKEIVREVKNYESGFLLQKLGFIHAIDAHFKKNRLRHSRQMYDRRMREFEKGRDIEVFVFFRGKFEGNKV